MAKIQVLDRAFHILDIIAREPDKPHFISELAREIGINNTTCTNIVTALASHGYLESLLKRRGYVLGPAPYVLTQKGSYKKVLIDIAYPQLKRLVADVNETCLLSTIRYINKLVLCEVRKDSPVQVLTDHLGRQDPFEVATGRVFIAFMGGRALTRLVKELGYPGDRWDGIDNEKKLQVACRTIRDDGYCIKKNPEMRYNSIAFPVFCDEKIEAAIGVFLQESAFTDSHRDHILKEMRITSENISRELSEFMRLEDPQEWRLDYSPGQGNTE